MNILIIATFVAQQCAAIVPVNLGTGVFSRVQRALQWKDISKYTKEAESLTMSSTPLFDIRGVINGEHFEITINKKHYFAVCVPTVAD
jgi:hypothetical protein